MKRDNETEEEAFERHQRVIEEIREELQNNQSYGWFGFLLGIIGTLSVFLFLREYATSSLDMVYEVNSKMNYLLVIMSISFSGMIYMLFKYFYPVYKRIHKSK